VRVLVVGDRGDSDAGYVGERLEELGAELRLTLRDELRPRGPGDSALRADLVLLLGSAEGVADDGREEAVEIEARLVRDALAAGVPVMAICYGAQLAAHALSGSVTKGGARELGWYYVESHDPALCPPGPWVQYHDDRFCVPDGARLTGMSEAGPQGFAVESAEGLLRLIAWQFHPEVSPAILERWVSTDLASLARRGIDVRALMAETRERAEQARASAHALVDVALDAMGLVRARV
jgi:GMP synthase-like glutamine amidotransferase